MSRLWKRSVNTFRCLMLVTPAAFLVTGCALFQQGTATEIVTKIVSLKPIEPKLTTLPKREQCLVPGKAEYPVEELEKANSCLAKQLLLTRNKFFTLVKTVTARDKAVMEGSNGVPPDKSTSGTK